MVVIHPFFLSRPGVFQSIGPFDGDNEVSEKQYPVPRGERPSACQHQVLSRMVEFYEYMTFRRNEERDTVRSAFKRNRSTMAQLILLAPPEPSSEGCVIELSSTEMYEAVQLSVIAGVDGDRLTPEVSKSPRWGQCWG